VGGEWGVRGVRGRGGIKVYPPSKFFAKLVNKNAIKHQKGVPSPQNFHSPYIPSLQNLAKTSWTLPQDFQTVCIYGVNQTVSLLFDYTPTVEKLQFNQEIAFTFLFFNILPFCMLFLFQCIATG
jgi:hypothetical protein